MDFTETTAVDAVVASFAETKDERLKELLTGLVQHLHAYVRETRPTVQEWEQAIEFLTAVGQKCDDTRQEFILLSDVLGVSMLVETINGQEAGTESTVLGPFHMVESPKRNIGDTIDLVGGDRPCVVELSLRAVDGEPLAGASIDVWQCDDNGYYDVQQPGEQPLGNGRGLFQTDQTGRVWFRTVVPSHYPIPTDGPVGTLLQATERHPFRPAHIHVIAHAPGYRELTTHLFVADGPYIESDAVFAVKKSLIIPFVDEDGERAGGYGAGTPVTVGRAEIVLEKELEQH
jgi:hydroxyquinol 1,2-dioxygenase